MPVEVKVGRLKLDLVEWAVVLFFGAWFGYVGWINLAPRTPGPLHASDAFRTQARQTLQAIHRCEEFHTVSCLFEAQKALDDLGDKAHGEPERNIREAEWNIHTALFNYLLAVEHYDRFDPRVHDAWRTAEEAVSGISLRGVAHPERERGPTVETPRSSAKGKRTSVAGSAPIHSATMDDGFVLVLRAKESSWVAIVADGQPVMEGVLATAETREVHAKKNAVLKLGNAAAVEVSHNGTTLPPLGRVGEVRAVVFTSEGLQP